MIKNKYWNIAPILSKKCAWNVVWSGRSNGKTYGVLNYAAEMYFKTGRTLAYIRRFDRNFTGQTGARVVYNSLMNNGEGVNRIKELSKGEYNGVEYYGGKYYLTKYDEDKGRTQRTDKVIAYGFALNIEEQYKGGSWADIHYICFDEFISRDGQYLSDEFVLLTNMISTIVRQRGDIQIFLLGNTINKYNPYFNELGMYSAKTQKQGTIDVYTYGDSGLSLAAEFAEMPVRTSKSNYLFAFKNPKLKAITNGVWELSIYPHCPCKILPKHIVFNYFVQFDGNTMQIDVVNVDGNIFSFCHIKTTPIKNPERDLIYNLEYSELLNRSRNFLKPRNNAEKRCLWLYQNDKMFYQDNEVGEMFNNYIAACKKL